VVLTPSLPPSLPPSTSTATVSLFTLKKIVHFAIKIEQYSLSFPRAIFVILPRARTEVRVFSLGVFYEQRRHSRRGRARCAAGLLRRTQQRGLLEGNDDAEASRVENCRATRRFETDSNQSAPLLRS